MSKPIITVIVPVFNEEEYIDRCMKSLEAQTYRRLQIILVDGGSTDGSAEKCDKWASKWNMGPDSNMGIVEVIHTSNKGVSASRNTGLKHATGDLITFLDGDDSLKSDALAVLYDLLTSSGADIAGCDFESIYPDEGPGGSDINPSDLEPEVMDTEGFIRDHVLHSDTHVWGRLYKRSTVQDIKFRQDLTIGEDMVYVIESAMKSSKIAHTAYPGYNYFRNPKGAMMRPFSASSMDQVKCWEEARLLIAHVSGDLSDGDDLRANMLISVMLTASKIALLDRLRRREKTIRDHIKTLQNLIREYKRRGAMKKLDHGYRFKVRLFKMMPNLYMTLYHMHKS